jgi:hypothetical protein
MRSSSIGGSNNGSNGSNNSNWPHAYSFKLDNTPSPNGLWYYKSFILAL